MWHILLSGARPPFSPKGSIHFPILVINFHSIRSCRDEPTLWPPVAAMQTPHKHTGCEVTPNTWGERWTVECPLLCFQMFWNIHCMLVLVCRWGERCKVSCGSLLTINTHTNLQTKYLNSKSKLITVYIQCLDNMYTFENTVQICRHETPVVAVSLSHV